MSRKLYLTLPLLALVLVASVLLLTSPQVVQGQSDDGRLNCDAAAPAVIYWTADGLEIYAVDGNDILLHVPQSVLDTAAPEEGYIELAANADGSIAVYLLSSGEIQVNIVNGDELYSTGFLTSSADPAWVNVYDMATWDLLSSGYGSCAETAEIVCWIRIADPVSPYMVYPCLSVQTELSEDCTLTHADGNNWYYDCHKSQTSEP